MLLEKKLIAGAKQLDIVLSDLQCSQLLTFLDLLEKWNKTYNLTAISNKETMVSKHILDSLSISPFVADTCLLDIGTGAGLPGIVLAIIKPKLVITLLDSVGKKCRFMQMAVANLGLKNVQIVRSRLEDYQPKHCFGQISARAFASIDKIQALSGRLLCENGGYLLMKSDKFLQEEFLPTQFTQHKLVVPYLDEAHYLLLLKSKKSNYV